MPKNKIYLKIEEKKYLVTLEDNIATQDLISHLKTRLIKVDMIDYELKMKLGKLGHYLPTDANFVEISPGDLFLYQNDTIGLCYGYDKSYYTKLGHLEDFTCRELLNRVGYYDIEIVLTLK